MLLSTSLLAETQYIENFHDPEYAVVFKSDGSMVQLKELGLPDGFKPEITGKEGGQYLFKGYDGEQYRVFVPEVVTSRSRKLDIRCDHSTIVLADDHRIASARGVGEDCL